MTASSAEELRKEGNELFKCGDYEGALTAYTQALSLGATPQDQAILHRNRAACHLKLEDYSKAESEASKAALTFSEAEAQSSTFVPLSSFGPQDLSLLLLPGDGGLMGADRAPVCAQPLKRTVGMSKHFIDEAKP